MAAPVPPCTPRSSRSQPADGRSDSFRSRDHGHCNSGQPHRRDPHAAKPFRRLFLGPMPVPASAAAATAAALAEDAATTDPVGIAVVGRKGTAVVGSREGSIASPSVAGRPSYSRSIGPSSASHPRSPSRSQSIDTAGSPPTSPLQRRVRELSPFSRNASSGAGHLDLPSSHASGAGARSRHMTRDVSGTSLASVRSFVSAKSMPSSVLSEGDAAARLPQRNMKGKPRREASTGSALGLGVPPSSGFSGAGLGLVRRASSKSEADESAYRSEEREGRRRRRSSSEWHHGWDSSHHGGPVLPLLDLPVTEADESVTPGEEVELLDMANGTGKGQGAGTIDQDKSDEDRLHPHDYAVPSGSPSRRGGSPLRSNAWRSLRTPSVPSVDHGTSSSIASQGRRAGSLDSTHARGYPMGSPSNTRAKHLASTSLSARRGSPASSLTRAQGKAYAQSSVGADEDPTLTTDEATPGQGGQSRRASLATQGTDGGSPFTGRTQRLKERARQRFSQGPAPRALIARQQSAGQGSLHARDFSQRSRMSRASTVGTINTMGTFGTDGSFGASGGMRSRLLALGGPLAGSYRGQQREGGPDYEDGRITAAKDRSVRRKHRTRKGSLTEGAHSGVGTSAGGTKWVGHSFEIGKRFWEVLDAQQARPEVDGLESGVEGDTSQAMFSGARSERQPSVDQTHEAQLRVSPASKQRPSLKVDTAQTQQGAQTAVAQGDQTSGREVQSPGGVLSTMADEANQAAETKKVAGSITGSDQHTPTARQQAFAGQAGDSTLDVPGSPQSTRTAQSLGTTTGTMMTRDQSVASLVTLQQSPDAETTFDIENRHGWSDVVSFITASSGGPSSIASRATRPTLGSIGSSSAGRRRLPILSSRPAYQQPSIIREASGSSQNQEGRDDVSMRTEDRVDHMSQQDTLKHPDPPISADERFPEITLDLLRRPSDSTDLPVTGETASDHEVAARSSPPPNPNAALGQDLVSSPDRLHGWSTANALPTQGTTLSTLASVDAPPRRSSRSPLLATSFTTSPAPSEVESPAQEPDVDARARTRSRGGTPKRKKTVQFRDSPEASGGRPTPLRSLSTGFFNRSSPPASGSSAKLGTQLPVHAHASPATAGSGDADPRPPEEVLNRPHPTSRPRTPGDTPGSDDQAKRHVEEQEIITRKTVLKRGGSTTSFMISPCYSTSSPLSARFLPFGSCRPDASKG